ncbi:alpha/beta fold hydrolase [Altererythrobacter lutimaris]|uniref:Alpha/beta hydrolase n=1 Tax=Altererythrobacter lutimaris TaxID=2743979 RepID=A0A850H5R5_9SPHN|nr:alpha/beta hydrolase [Altererythrobacter lutimaris]NVE94554.1 alpha/beta hydrolase [Altererythrobacter lutimaris]
MEMKRVKLSYGIELDVVDIGPRDAPALIFLHGFPENHRSWRHQIAHFSDRYRCIAPDMRGYRGSSKPEGVENYSPDKLIGDVFALASALEIENFTIVGHDWGGAISWGVALGGQTGPVTRAIVANGPHPATFQKLLYTNRIQREASQYMRGFKDTANDVLVREKGLLGLLEQEINWDAHYEMEPEERAILLEDWQNRDAALAMLNYYRATPTFVPPMDAPFELPADFSVPPLPKLEIPTLVIWGEDDTALPAENLEGMEDLVSDLSIVTVPECGHFVQWQRPDAVIVAMERFLARTA